MSHRYYDIVKHPSNVSRQGKKDYLSKRDNSAPLHADDLGGSSVANTNTDTHKMPPRLADTFYYKYVCRYPTTIRIGK